MGHVEKLDQAARPRQRERSVVITCCLVSGNQTRGNQMFQGALDDDLGEASSSKIELREDAANLPDLFVVLKYKAGAGQLAVAFDSEPLRAVLEILGQFSIFVSIGAEHRPGTFVVGTELARAGVRLGLR